MEKQQRTIARKRRPDVPPWLEGGQLRRDFAEGRTMGRDWDRLDCHAADVAVRSNRERRIIDTEWKAACRVASQLGLLAFNVRYFHTRWCEWRYGAHHADVED